MIRKGRVFYEDRFCGMIEETETGYRFTYDARYLVNPESTAVSKTMPLTHEPYTSKTMFPFFDGLIPEGWLLDIAKEHWKIDERDRMALLLSCCKDCIGAVSVKALSEDE